MSPAEEPPQVSSESEAGGRGSLMPWYTAPILREPEATRWESSRVERKVNRALVKESVITELPTLPVFQTGRVAGIYYSSVVDSTVEGSGNYIGGIMGNTSAQEGISQVAVVGCTVQGTGATSMGVGGIAGRNEGTWNGRQLLRCQ